jgi:hypothetical protein
MHTVEFFLPRTLRVWGIILPWVRHVSGLPDTTSTAPTNKTSYLDCWQFAKTVLDGRGQMDQCGEVFSKQDSLSDCDLGSEYIRWLFVISEGAFFLKVPQTLSIYDGPSFRRTLLAIQGLVENVFQLNFIKIYVPVNCSPCIIRAFRYAGFEAIALNNGFEECE